MIILIDGPEKSGKSTLIKSLAKRMNATIRNWGPVDPDDRVYAQPLLADAQSDKWFIWDRGWPSEHIYGRLLKRDRRLVTDPFLGEWLYGRAVLTRGVRFIVLPDDVASLKLLRNSSDLQVDYRDEYALYRWYAQDFGYRLIVNTYQHGNLLYNTRIAADIAGRVARSKWAGKINVPQYAGPLDASIVFVGEARGEDEGSLPGAFLPFSSHLTMMLGRRIGNKSLTFGWTNIADVPIEFLRNKLVIGCGNRAGQWLGDYHLPRFVIPHPSWLYRFNTERLRNRKEVTELLLKVIGER